MIFFRHLIPLSIVLVLGHSAGHFLLLTVFNLALTMSTLAVVGVAVSMRGKYISTMDQIAGLTTLLAVGLGVTLLLTALFGWVVAVLIDATEGSLMNPELIGSAALMLVCNVPHAWRQYQDGVKNPMSEVAAQQRDRPLIFAHLFSAGLVFMLAPYAFEFGRIGLLILACLLTGVFVFRDLRPDLIRRLAPGGV
ncbi:hypothetical protein [Ahniella affigens]|uniref:hypothetical protein n=1 Tax=Ahniella affigens TaxID=2021234 RepID=UPI0011B26567|nr:hypothetical protein [Ahniella affigens]